MAVVEVGEGVADEEDDVVVATEEDATAVIDELATIELLVVGP